MPRKPTIISDIYPYHVTARSNNKEWFDLELQEVWEIMSQRLKLIQLKEGAVIHSFILMTNHFHLILTTPRANISKIMYWFMKTATLEIQKRTGRINKIFGGRYKACLITTERYLFNATRYVYQNPLRAGMSKEAEKYPYSTLFTTINNIKLPFVITPNCQLSLELINSCYTEKERSNISLALSRTEFRSPKDRRNRKKLI